MFMQKNHFLWMFVLGVALCACSLQTAGTSEESEGVVAISNKQIAGVAQKGPFVTGSNVVLKETSANGRLKTTGREFFATTRSDQGDFVIEDVNLESQYVRLTATGYYKSETTNENSKCQVSLNALSDISNRGLININVFTHLEYERVLYLVEDGKSFVEAQRQAHVELMKNFGYEWISENSENLDVTDTSKAGKALERISSGLDLAMNDAQKRADDGVRCEAAQEVVDVLAEMFRKSGDFLGDFETEYAPRDVITSFVIKKFYSE